MFNQYFIKHTKVYFCTIFQFIETTELPVSFASSNKQWPWSSICIKLSHTAISTEKNTFISCNVFNMTTTQTLKVLQCIDVHYLEKEGQDNSTPPVESYNVCKVCLNSWLALDTSPVCLSEWMKRRVPACCLRELLRWQNVILCGSIRVEWVQLIPSSPVWFWLLLFSVSKSFLCLSNIIECELLWIKQNYLLILHSLLLSLLSVVE